VKAIRLSVRKQLTLNILWFGLNAQTAALLPIVIPTQIVLFISSSQVGSAQQVLFLSWLMGGAAVISLFMPPAIGTLSDRTRGGFGRRRPYIAVGGLLLLMSTPLLVNSGSIIIFLIGLSLLLIGKNVLQPAYQSLVPDHVSENQRGETAGYVGGMTILGNVVGLGLAAWLLGGVSQHAYSASLVRTNAGIYYVVTAVLVLVGLLITVFGVREIPLLVHKHETTTGQQELTCASRQEWMRRFAHHFVHDWIEPWHDFNFTMVFLTRASLMLGLALFMTYIEYYFARVQHVANFVQVTGIVAMLALGGAVVSGVIAGFLSDRIKRRAPVVCVATLLMAIAALSFVIFPDTLMAYLFPLGIFFGLGYGAYSSVDWALSIDVLPNMEKAGKDLGVWSASGTLPGVAAPIIGSMIISIAAGSGNTGLGYQLVFGAATLFFVLAAVGILFVKK